MIDFQSALKAVQNPIARLFLFASKWGPPHTKEWAEHNDAPPVPSLLFVFT